MIERDISAVPPHSREDHEDFHNKGTVFKP